MSDVTVAEGVKAREIESFDGYAVSRDGRVWTCKCRGPTGGCLDQWHEKQAALVRGHCRVSLWKESRLFYRYVHRLVLEAFVGPCPDGMECRHFPDRDPENNHIENLSWGTRQENSADRIAHGTEARGERNGNATLNDSSVRQIRQRFSKGATLRGLARSFGVHYSQIKKVVTRKTWSHVA